MWRSVAAAAPRTEAAPGQGAEGGPEGKGPGRPGLGGFSLGHPVAPAGGRTRLGGAGRLMEKRWPVTWRSVAMAVRLFITCLHMFPTKLYKTCYG